MNNFLLQHKKKRYFINPESLLLLLIILGAGTHVVYPHITSGVAHVVATPLWSLERYTTEKIANTSALLASKKHLILKNNILEQQLQSSQLEARTISLLEEENRVLKELLGRSTDVAPLIATVLTRPNVSLYDTFVIDVGSYEGLVGGERVAVSGDIVIGTVETVFSHTSLVKLFSTPGVETHIMVGAGAIEAIALGQGGGNFIVQLPREIGVEEGDMVTMPGINTKLFGVVEKVITDPTQPFQRMLFKNPVNMAELRFVNILHNDE